MQFTQQAINHKSLTDSLLNNINIWITDTA